MSTREGGRKWLVRNIDPDARARVFCFPVAGMGASAYRDWPTRIDDVEICPVQLPGRENRITAPAHTSMEEFVKDAADALQPYLDKPFAFFGHCFGARLSYGLAVELASRGGPLPVQLFASSCLAPHRGGYFGGGRSGPFTPQTTDEEYMEELRYGCEQRGEPTPPPELLELSIMVLRADIELTCGYQPPGPDSTPLDVTTISWTGDTHMRPEEMDEWEAYGNVRQVLLPGDDSTHRSAPADLLQVIADGIPA
ncbi:thioesterase domain-containing protein [Streptomyces sp. NPDC005562]|uniref:thioesterase II family protein n=1 Tax=Streptomyces sp. NPDC005562 TaxID=3154890 RepID=UPI0033AD99E6